MEKSLDTPSQPEKAPSRGENGSRMENRSGTHPVLERVPAHREDGLRMENCSGAHSAPERVLTRGEDPGSPGTVSGLRDVDLFRAVREKFGVGEVDIRTYSPLALAFIGDGVYDLVVRSLIVGKGSTRPGQLHQRTSHLVKAHTQSVMMDSILPVLSDEEADVYRRGRNAKSPTMARHATSGDYHRATGFEALMGFLYLRGEFCRILDLTEIGFHAVEADEAAAVGADGRV